jgi:hypothetical protein
MTTQTICVTVPLRIRSEANLREHWRTKHKRSKEQKFIVGVALAKHRPPAVEKIEITLTRQGVRKLDDDNLAGGCKGVRDQIAAWLGIDDGSDRLTWRYRQEKSKEYGLVIHVAWQIEEEACAALSAIAA